MAKPISVASLQVLEQVLAHAITGRRNPVAGEPEAPLTGNLGKCRKALFEVLLSLADLGAPISYKALARCELQYRKQVAKAMSTAAVGAMVTALETEVATMGKAVDVACRHATLDPEQVEQFGHTTQRTIDECKAIRSLLLEVLAEATLSSYRTLRN